MINTKKIFSFQPQIPGYEESGPEPCIGELVYRYYRTYFDEEDALELSSAYFAGFDKITDILH